MLQSTARTMYYQMHSNAAAEIDDEGTLFIRELTLNALYSMLEQKTLADSVWGSWGCAGAFRECIQRRDNCYADCYVSKIKNEVFCVFVAVALSSLM